MRKDHHHKLSPIIFVGSLIAFTSLVWGGFPLITTHANSTETVRPWKGETADPELGQVTLYLDLDASHNGRLVTASPGGSLQTSFSGTRVWDGPGILTGDIFGDTYKFYVSAASFGTTQFRASLKINNLEVASFDFSASSTTFSTKYRAVSGIDPDLDGASSVRLEIMRTGGDQGGILMGGHSYVVLPYEPPPTVNRRAFIGKWDVESSHLEVGDLPPGNAGQVLPIYMTFDCVQKVLQKEPRVIPID